MQWEPHIQAGVRFKARSGSFFVFFLFFFLVKRVVPRQRCLRHRLLRPCRLPGFPDCLDSQIAWIPRLPGFPDCLDSQIAWILRLPGFPDCLDSQIAWIPRFPGTYTPVDLRMLPYMQSYRSGRCRLQLTEVHAFCTQK